LSDPDRWFDSDDDPQLKALCRGCARRFVCAKDALESPRVEGMIAAIFIPKSGRQRSHALRQLQSLAAHAGLADQPDFPR
jgi:WhiB family redox-sensing transcriptional regulator